MIREQLFNFTAKRWIRNVLAIPREQIVHFLLCCSRNVDSIDGRFGWQTNAAQDVFRQGPSVQCDRKNGNAIHNSEARWLPPDHPPDNKRDQDSLSLNEVGFLTRGRPLGRTVDCKPNRLTVDSTHSRSPQGHPFLAESRTADSSFSVNGWLTSSIQPRRRGIG